MNLVSWTLAGQGTAPIIGDALRSVAPIVDACMVVWTGGANGIDDGSDVWNASVHGLRSHAPAYDDNATSIKWHEWVWCDDYAAARNAAFAHVEEVNAWCFYDWSVMVDTDERVICHDPAAFHAWLSSLNASVQVVLVHHNDGSHTRERFFRMPARYRFIGRTHEMLPCPESEQAIAPRELIQWSELPKTREALKKKFLRDVKMLRQDIIANPRNGAACYYLGTSLQALAVYAREDGDEAYARATFPAAIEAFREHREIDTSSGRAWHEGTAFSCYRAAECYLALGNPNRALDCVAAGLVLDSGIGELYWIAAVASLQEGRTEQARAWAMSAKAHGMGSASEKRRRGFRVVRGLTTGPDEVLEVIDRSRASVMSVGFV